MTLECQYIGSAATRYTIIRICSRQWSAVGFGGSTPFSGANIPYLLVQNSMASLDPIMLFSQRIYLHTRDILREVMWWLLPPPGAVMNGAGVPAGNKWILVSYIILHTASTNHDDLCVTPNLSYACSVWRDIAAWIRALLRSDVGLRSRMIQHAEVNGESKPIQSGAGIRAPGSASCGPCFAFCFQVTCLSFYRDFNLLKMYW